MKGVKGKGLRPGAVKGSTVKGSLPVGSEDGGLGDALRGLPPRVRAFYREYSGGERLDAGEAAKRVGYQWPEVMGSRLRRRYPSQTAKAEELWRARQTLQPDELRRINAEIARGQESAFKEGAQVAAVRLKALELAARMHGLLSDKLDVTLSRKDLLVAIKEKMASIEQSVSQEITMESPQLTEPDKAKQAS